MTATAWVVTVAATSTIQIATKQMLNFSVKQFWYYDIISLRANWFEIIFDAKIQVVWIGSVKAPYVHAGARKL